MLNDMFDNKSEALAGISKATFLSPVELKDDLEQCDCCKRWGLSAYHAGAIMGVCQEIVDKFGYDRVCEECINLLEAGGVVPARQYITLLEGFLCLIDRKDDRDLLKRHESERLHEFEKRCSEHGRSK